MQLDKDRATEYARKVVSGEVVAGLPHIQAYQRHLNDIKKSQTEPDYPYVWNPSLSERIINYVETLTIVEGQMNLENGQEKETDEQNCSS